MIDKSFHLHKKRYVVFLFILLGYSVLCFIDLKASVKQEFYSPFDDSDRKSYESIKRRLVGSYGEYRKSYKPGHLHAGIDLEGSFNEKVYAIGYGQVWEIFRDFPHQTVIVRHNLPGGGLCDFRLSPASSGRGEREPHHGAAGNYHYAK